VTTTPQAGQAETDALHVLMPHCGLRSGSQLGGEVFERQLLLRLPDYGVFPHIGLPSSRGLETVPAGWDVDLLRPGRGLRWYLAPAAFLPYSLRQLRGGKIDLIRAHSPRFVGPSLLAARGALGLQVPLVVHHHHGEPGAAGAADRWVLRRASLVVVPSRVVRDEVVADGVSPARVAVVPNGAELPAPHADGVLWRRPPGARLLYVSRLVPRKRPLLAIETAAALAPDFPELELIFVGRGELAEAAHRHARALGVADRVQFVEWVSEEAKAWLLETADLFLMPSVLEGFGLVALESQLAGTPVVGGPASALAEVVVAGETGLLAGDDDASFVVAARALLENPERRAAFGAAARRNAARFSWSSAAAATADAYRRTLAGARS